jgi:hypothetical protein
MEPEGSLPHSQQPNNGPYLSHIHPCYNLQSYFFKVNFNIIFPLWLNHPRGLFFMPSEQNNMYFFSLPCVAQALPISFSSK